MDARAYLQHPVAERAAEANKVNKKWCWYGLQKVLYAYVRMICNCIANCFVHKSVSCEVVLITFSAINTYLQYQFSIETSLGHEFIFAKTSVSICTLC